MRIHSVAGVALSFLAWALALPASGGRAEDRPLSPRPVSPEDEAFFEQKVRPLLVERCYECHSTSKEVKGGLRLDSRQGWQRGGDTGPAMIPGKPDESLLIKAVRYGDADLKMPPAGKLDESQIAILEQWARLGAPDPRDVDVVSPASGDSGDAGRSHWAFQELLETALPAVRDTDWPLGDVDRFILAALEQQGLHPSPDADRRTWLRRVSLDLTGLPPTRQEIQSFDEDQSDDAWARVVDRLLASRAFGERWARPWLDLVGYADQIGSANNVPAEHAWRYRDYVIRSIDSDKPFDAFVREQIAGDLLSADSIEERQDQLTATGFLVLGNVNIVEADKLIMRMDLVDQQVEKVGKTFLGLTLNCVRCHDHKFDPVTLQDYYGLAGIFASSESTYKEERGLWSSVTKAQLPETLDQFTQREAASRAHERQVAAVRSERAAAETRLKELEPLIAAAKSAMQAGGAADAKPLAELEQEAAALAAKVKALERQGWHLNYLKPSPPVAFVLKESAEIADSRIQVRGNPYVLGEAVPRGFVAVVTHGPAPAISGGESGRLQLAQWLTGAASPLVARVTVNRLWQALFGRGIVASVDYFGVRGERPTHPELLDLLAGQFIRDDWSRKRLIRSLVLSRAYRQRTDADETAQPAIALDPDNRLLWRMSPRRLDAEMLRDSVLVVSGGLDAGGGGKALAPEFAENVGGLDPKDVNPINFSLAKFPDHQLRARTIYLPVVRSSEQRGPAEALNFFDFAQPARFSGDRPTTAVASQALFLLNGPLLNDAASRLSAELLADASLTNDHLRVTDLYLRVLSRPPEPAEAEAARAFLSESDGATAGAGAEAGERTIAWRRLIHALLASNEFLFRM